MSFSYSKQDIDDVRESPALDVIELLRQKGADVRCHDPFVPSIRHNGFEMAGEPDPDATLPSAHTHGASYEEAARNGQEVLELLVRSYEQMHRSLPEPTRFAYAGG